MRASGVMQTIAGNRRSGGYAGIYMLSDYCNTVKSAF
jgi:hypothetical protein